MQRLVLASSNPHKQLEIEQALTGCAVTLVTQKTLGIAAAVETGNSFLDNALLKAHHVFQLTGGAVLADDSGLVVPSIGGQPGILSARYAGDSATDADNNKRLLKQLTGKTGDARKAFFVCALVYVYPDAKGKAQLHTSEHYWHGTIAEAEHGTNGFGYDSLFIPEGSQKSAADLSTPEKNVISHRGKALQWLRVILTQTPNV